MNNLKTYHRFLLGLFLLTLIIPCKNAIAQSLAFDILDGKKEITIPFELKQGYIVMNLRFHNSFPLSFIYDTGAENTILFQKKISDVLNLTYDKTVEVQGPDAKEVINAYITRGVYLTLENTANVKRDIIVLEKDILALDKVIGVPINGIIGASFFKGLYVQIDYLNQEVIIYDGRYFNNNILKKYKEVPILMNQSKAYLKCEIEIRKNQNQNVNLLLDTGAGLSILLYDELHPNKETVEIPTGKLGVVVSGALQGYLGEVQKLKFGDFEFQNLISSLIQLDTLVTINSKSKKKGLIGSVLLSRFDIIIDNLNNKLYFKAHKSYNEKIEYNKSGIELYATGEKLNKFLINSIVKGSAAYFAGLKKGDIITKINGLSTKWRSFDNIMDIFSAKVGKRVNLTIVRNESAFNASFILYDFFRPIEQNIKYIWAPKTQYEIY